MKKFGSSMISFLVFLIAGYLLLLSLMYLFQRQLIFFPTSNYLITPEKAGLNAENVWISTQDGEKLHGWFFPVEESEYVVVLSHGNAGNISNRIDIGKLLSEIGFSVLLYDYRGYGKSTGKPDEQGLYTDIESVVQYLNTEKGFKEVEMIMYGRSLGGAVAAYAASKYLVAGLVIDSAFENLKTMVADLYPFVPSSLAAYEFPTENYLSKITNIPVMIMHSRNDEIINFSHGQKLFEIANEPKRFVELRGGHNDNFHESADIHIEHWNQFLNLINENRNLDVIE